MNKNYYFCLALAVRMHMEKRNNENELMKPAEVAHLLNIHINTVRRWSNEGILRAYRISSRGDRRFKKQDILNLLNRSVDLHDNNTDATRANL